MSRTARIIVPNFPYHVTQRGNYRQAVFENDRDLQIYLTWIKEYSDKYGLKIWTYCLMSNHVHFVAVPMHSDSLSRTFNHAHMRYSQYFNNKKGQSGHLWQGRFYSCCLDETHLFAAVRYVENNPVRAGLVENAEDYPWSSAPGHIYAREKQENPILSRDMPLLKMIPDWREFLLEEEEISILNKLRSCTLSGLPAGTDCFISILEGILGKKIAKRPKGRPRKPENA
jgi:putative transposase